MELEYGKYTPTNRDWGARIQCRQLECPQKSFDRNKYKLHFSDLPILFSSKVKKVFWREGSVRIL